MAIQSAMGMGHEQDLGHSERRLSSNAARCIGAPILNPVLKR